MKNQFTMTEFMNYKITGLPKTRRGMDKYADKNNWQYIEVLSAGRGGVRREYVLPKALYEVVRLQALAALANAADVSSVVAQKSSTELSKTQVTANAAILADWQRDCAIARLAVVRYVLKLADLAGKTKAVEGFEKASKEGSLDMTWVSILKCANAKSGGKEGNVTVSRRTLFKWIKNFEVSEVADNASAVALLAPKAREVTMPEWAGILLKLWGDPAKPELAEVMRRINHAFANSDATLPSYHQARYFLQTHVGNVERQRGRMGSREIKNIKPFVRRDASVLLPSDVYTADGHTCDAEVAHPNTGKPFRPEITSVLDVHTRMIVGYSIDLAESGLAVLAAISSAACDYGIPAIFYVDNGSGYKNAMMTDDATGLMTRLGTEMKHSIAYNSQARGMIERLHKTIWVRLARRLSTYVGADMDRQAKQAVYKKTRKEIKQIGVSRVLVSWSDFLVLAAEAVHDYNNEPHSGLPRRYNKMTGRREYLTPQIMWDEQVEAMTKAGYGLVTVSGAERDDLYRPYVSRKCQRGELNVFNNRYFSRELEQYHDETVLVGYDIHDGSRIWVRDSAHRLIAIAEFEGNKKGYFEKNAVDDAYEKRAIKQVKRAQTHVDSALENLVPYQVLEHTKSQMISKVDIKRAEVMLSECLASNDAQVVETESVPILRQTTWDKLNALAASFDQQYTESIQPKSDSPKNLKYSDMSQDEKFAYWLALDTKEKEGLVLDESDQGFYDTYPESNIFATKMREYLN